MDHEDRNDGRSAADQIAARYAGKARAVMRRAAVASMANSESTQGPEPAKEAKVQSATKAVQQEFNFCPGCEFVRIMNPDGVGYCKEHGDIQ